MRRTDVFALTYGGVETLLTCPAGHKYEVLEVTLWGDSSAGITYALCATLGGTFVILDEIDAKPAGQYSWRSRWDALVLMPDDALQIVASGGSGNYAPHVVYVDVDET